LSLLLPLWLHRQLRFAAFILCLLDLCMLLLLTLLLWVRSRSTSYRRSLFCRGPLLRLLLRLLRLLRLVDDAEVPEHQVADEDLLIERTTRIRELDMRQAVDCALDMDRITRVVIHLRLW
jgi:hypothetical protein